jgi:hypothetical protein
VKPRTAGDLIGASVGVVRDRIGEPDSIDGSRWTYGTGQTPLYVYFNAGKVIDARPKTFPLYALKPPR